MSMRRIAVPLAISLSTLLGAACASDAPWSPNDPKQFDGRMFQSAALEKYSPGDRAYVMGHAIGTYLFGKSMPGFVAPRGYIFVPGRAAHQAQIDYSWSHVMASPSGGIDGVGGGIPGGGVAYFDPEFPPPQDGCNDNDVGTPCSDPCADDDPNTYCPIAPGTPINPPGTGMLPPGSGNPPGGGMLPPGSGNPPGGGQLPPGSGNPPGTGQPPAGCLDNDPDTACPGGDDVGNPSGSTCDPGTDDTCPTPPNPIDPSCEAFLDPAAVEARQNAKNVDPDQILGADYGGDQHAAYVARFNEGMWDALHVQDFKEDVRHSEVEKTKVHARVYGLCDHSPLVFDLDGDGVQGSSIDRGVWFDMTGTGALATAWTTGDDALLALDRNGDGRITAGTELFGDARGADGTRAANGFEALAQLDSPLMGGNGDGVLDARDAAFGALVLWRDVDHDGQSQPWELEPLAAERIEAIDLGYSSSNAVDAAGNRLAQHGSFLRRDTHGALVEGSVVDVWFRSR